MNFWEFNFFATSTNSNVDFTSSNVWSITVLIGILLLSVIIAHILKTNIKFLKKTLIPTSVLGGILVLIFSSIYQLITKNFFFDLPGLSITNSDNETIITGTEILQTITYHALGIGFVAMGLRQAKKKTKKITGTDIFNTGVTTVSTYLLQAAAGIIITIIFAKLIPNLIPGSGVLLALGYGQGTGQALNFGSQFETAAANAGITFYGANFGLTIAALGFLSASVGGVIYLNVIRAQGKIKDIESMESTYNVNDFQGENEIESSGSIDKLTIEVAIVLIAYVCSFFLMKGLSKLVPGMASTIYGFNFLLGTLFAVLFKAIHNFLYNKKILKKNYISNYLLNRIAGVAFDIMIVAGIAVINLELLADYWYVLLILGVVGLVLTLVYIRFVCHKLFPDYKYEEFFGMYGMLTGTASTGMILLREIDPNYESPAADNMVYQNFPAIIFGLPLIMWILPALINGKLSAWVACLIIIGFFILMQIILFRKFIFKKKNK